MDDWKACIEALEALAETTDPVAEILEAEGAPAWRPTAYESRYLPGLRRIGAGNRPDLILQNVADLHIHTEASDGGPIDEVLDRAMDLHLDAIAITDHDVIEGAIEARRRAHERRLPLAVIPGVEVSTRDGHVGALFVTRPIPKDLSARETLRLIHEAGGLAVAHHPFVPHLLERLAGKKLGVGLAFETLDFDAVEVTNAVPGFGSGCNRMVHERVREQASTLAFTGSSDAHHAEQVGKGLTYYPGNEGLLSLRRALENGLTMGAEAYWSTGEKLRYYLRLAGRILRPPVPAHVELDPPLPAWVPVS